MELLNPSRSKCSSKMKRHKQCRGVGCYSHGNCDNTLRKNGRCHYCDKAIYIGDTKDQDE